MTIGVQLLIFLLALDADLLPAQRDFIDDTSSPHCWLYRWFWLW